MSDGPDDSDKSFEPTPQKLQKAREKGDFARSQDLNTAAAYAGLTLAFLLAGVGVTRGLGTELMVLLDQAARLGPLIVSDGPNSLFGGILLKAGQILVPLFTLPALAVTLTIAAQRGFVFAPTKVEPKLSKISLISNAKQKFGRNGLFEFAKSFVKLVVFSLCLGLFLRTRAEDMIVSVGGNSRITVMLLSELCIAFLCVVVLISLAIGGIDAVWQHTEHVRKNMMSRKEVMDENKDNEGDPHLKQARRQRAQTIAMSQMMGDVPEADVIIVNPTHYAVALKWARTPGSAPKCVAKGIDDIAARIRTVASENGVPIHSDPPTARALHATTEIGHEIAPEHYQAVAASIRFAEKMRQRAKQAGW